MLTWLRTFRRRFLTRRLRGRRRTSLPRQTAPLFEPLETRALLSATPVGPTADDHPAVDHLPVDLQDLVQELTSHCPQDSDHLPQGPPEGDVPPLDRLGVKIREVIAEHVPFEQTPPTMDDLEDIFEQIKQRIVDKLDPAGEEPTEEGDEAVEQQTKLDVDGLVGSKTISASDHVPDGGDELPPVGEGPAVDVHSIVAERVADGSPALDRVPGGGEDSSAAVSAALADVEDAETSSGGSDGASDGESAGASDGESAGESDGDTSGDSDVSEGGSDVSEGGTDVSDGGSDGSDGGEDGEIAAGIAAAVTDAEESHSDGGGDHGEGHRPIDVQALVTENTDGRGSSDAASHVPASVEGQVLPPAGQGEGKPDDVGNSAGESDGDTAGDSDVSEGGSDVSDGGTDVSEGGTDVSDGGSDGSDGGEDGEIASGIAAAVTDAEESHSDGGGDHGEGHRPIDVQTLVTANTDGRGSSDAASHVPASVEGQVLPPAGQGEGQPDDAASDGASDGDTAGDSDASEGGSDVSDGGTDVSDGGTDGSDGGTDVSDGGTDMLPDLGLGSDGASDGESDGDSDGSSDVEEDLLT